MEINKKYQQILRLLELIDNVNQAIKLESEMNSQLLLKQNLHLKSKYAQELFTLLLDFQLPIEFKAEK